MRWGSGGRIIRLPVPWNAAILADLGRASCAKADCSGRRLERVDDLKAEGATEEVESTRLLGARKAWRSSVGRMTDAIVVAGVEWREDI